MTITAFIIGTFVSASIGNSIKESLTISIITTLMISFWPVFGGLSIIVFFPSNRKFIKFFLFFLGIIALTLWGEYLARQILFLYAEPSAISQIQGILKIQWIPSLLIAVLTGLPSYYLFSNFQKKIVPQKNKKDEIIEISINRRSIPFSISDIIFFEAKGRRTLIFTNQNEYLSSTPLRFFTHRLKDKGFIRVHKSFLVNPFYISFIEKSTRGGGRYLRLKDSEDSSIPIGRVFEKELKNRLG